MQDFSAALLEWLITICDRKALLFAHSDLQFIYLFQHVQSIGHNRNVKASRVETTHFDSFSQVNQFNLPTK